jgi:hypothetical protein
MSYKECSNFTIEKSIIAEEACPSFPRRKKYLHKEFKDPFTIKGDKYKILKEFRATRDDIKKWIRRNVWRMI